MKNCGFEGSGWTLHSILCHQFVISEIASYVECLYCPLPKELRNSVRKSFNTQNNDNEWFRWFIVRYLNHRKKNPGKIRNDGREFEKQECVKFLVHKKDYAKIEKQNNISINVFGYENKTPFQHVDLLPLLNAKNLYHVLSKDFSRFMNRKTNHHGKKHFCWYYLECCSSSIILESYKENCLAINQKRKINLLLQEGICNEFWNSKRLLKALFVIYANSQCVLVSLIDNNYNGPNSEEYQDHIFFGYGYKLICVDE